MIKRRWHRWTTRENAQPYQHLLRTEILPAIGARNIAGYHGSELLRVKAETKSNFRPIVKATDWKWSRLFRRFC